MPNTQHLAFGLGNTLLPKRVRVGIFSQVRTLEHLWTTTVGRAEFSFSSFPPSSEQPGYFGVNRTSEPRMILLNPDDGPWCNVPNRRPSVKRRIGGEPFCGNKPKAWSQLHSPPAKCCTVLGQFCSVSHIANIWVQFSFFLLLSKFCTFARLISRAQYIRLKIIKNHSLILSRKGYIREVLFTQSLLLLLLLSLLLLLLRFPN